MSWEWERETRDFDPLIKLTFRPADAITVQATRSICRPFAMHPGYIDYNGTLKAVIVPWTSTLELLGRLNRDGLEPAKVSLRYAGLNEQQVAAIRQAVAAGTTLDVDDPPAMGRSVPPTAPTRGSSSVAVVQRPHSLDAASSLKKWPVPTEAAVPSPPLWVRSPLRRTMVDAQGDPRRVVRTYPGYLTQAAADFDIDRAQMARAGWVDVSQQYLPGTWGPVPYVVALLLIGAAVGFVLLFYLLSRKPAGGLLVTYEYREFSAGPVQRAGGSDRHSPAHADANAEPLDMTSVAAHD
jgi:hypothetical protein